MEKEEPLQKSDNQLHAESLRSGITAFEQALEASETRASWWETTSVFLAEKWTTPALVEIGLTDKQINILRGGE